jgi:integrase
MAWIYERPGTEHFWIGYRINGKQVLRSTGTSDRKEADKELAKIEMAARASRAGLLTDELIKQLTGKTGQTEFTLHAMLQQWLAECKSLSPATLERYKTVMDQLSEYIHATETAPLLRQIAKETIAAFLRNKRAATTAANAKLNRRVLAAFFNYCVRNDALEKSPVPDAVALKLNGESERVRRAFTLVELSTIYQKCPNDFWRYMVMSGFFLGQRMGDLICMVWGAIDFEQNVVRLTASKTGRPVVIPLKPELRAFLWQLKASAGRVNASDPIWPEQSERYAKQGAGGFSNEFYSEVLLPAGLVSKRTHQAPKSNGKPAATGRKINPVSFHCLRHSFVSFLKMTGASQSTAKELAGHSSDEISDLYTHVDGETLTRAIAGLPALTTN